MMVTDEPGWPLAIIWRGRKLDLRQLLARPLTEGPYTHTYSYDAHGSMTAMPHLSSMIWNHDDELQEVTVGTETVYFQYAGGMRSRKYTEKDGTTTEERIYLGGFEIYRKRSGEDLELERESLHISDGTGRICIVETKTFDEEVVESPTGIWRYQLGNHLGSAATEVDEDGEVISYEEYHPYGTSAYRAVDSSVDVSAKRYRYTGMERDEETSLEYHSARYYAPWLGRWSAADPMGLVDGVNRWCYCKGSPAQRADRNGRQAPGDEYWSNWDPSGANDSYVRTDVERPDDWIVTEEFNGRRGDRKAVIEAQEARRATPVQTDANEDASSEEAATQYPDTPEAAAKYARENGVEAFSQPFRFRVHVIERNLYPEERGFLALYYPEWFWTQDFVVQNVPRDFPSHSFYGLQVALRDEYFSLQGPYAGLSPLRHDDPGSENGYVVMGHETFHGFQRQLGRAGDIRRSAITRHFDEDYYEYDTMLTDPEAMFQEFLQGNIEQQAEIFEDAMQYHQLYLDALATGTDSDIEAAEDTLRPYIQVLDYVKSMPPDGRL